MKKACLKISGKYLFLEQVLVYFDLPLFFICKDMAENRFAVLCYDDEDLDYIVAEVSLKDIVKMLQNEIPMDVLFTSARQKWQYQAGVDVETTFVNPVRSFENEQLPTKGSFFGVLNAEVSGYLQRLKAENTVLLERVGNKKLAVY